MQGGVIALCLDPADVFTADEVLGAALAYGEAVDRCVAGQLFLRSYERSDRIYNAMLARGYSGQLRTLHPHVMKSSDWFFVAMSIVVILLLQLTGRF